MQLNFDRLLIHLNSNHYDQKVITIDAALGNTRAVGSTSTGNFDCVQRDGDKRIPPRVWVLYGYPRNNVGIHHSSQLKE